MVKGIYDGTPTFLSIDMDFLGESHESEYGVDMVSARRLLNHLVLFASQKNIPISAVMNHHQMLDQVNNSGALRLVNYDAHSDLADIDIDEFCCGTWVSYVKWRNRGDYIWLRKNQGLQLGECGYCFGCGHCAGCKATDWLKVRSRLAYSPPTITMMERMNTVGISVCLSPEFTHPCLQTLFRKWVKDNNIQYTKGRTDEFNFTTPRVPPKCYTLI